MLKFNTSAANARIKRSTKGAEYDPEETRSPLQAVAINDAAIKAKFIIL